MRVLAEVPPLVVPGAYTAIALGACLSFAFLWVFDKVWRNSIGFLFEKIGNTGFGGIAGHGSVRPLHFLVDWSHTVENRTRLAMAASEHAIVYGFGALLWAFYDLAFTIAKTAYDFNAAIDNLWAHVTHGTTKILHETVVKPAAKAVKYVDAKLTARVHTLENQFGTLAAKVAHIAIPLPRSLPHADSYFDRLLRQGGSLRARAHRLEQLLTVAGLGALAVAALSRLGFGCFFGRNGKMIGRRLCRVNSDWLDALLLGGLAVSSVVSVREFARDIAAVEEDVIDILSRLVREFPSAQEIVQLDGVTFPH